MRSYASLSRRALQFLLTESCNLNCVYCYEHRKTSRSLSTEFICEKITEAMLAEDEYEEVEFDFFGGEPLLQFETIRKVVDWFHAQNWPATSKRYLFMVGTNGTLLNEERKQWFERNRHDVVLCLSLDGTPTAQNRNRSNSYDLIAPHLEFVRRCWPLQPIKMTIGPQSIDQVYEGVVHLHSLGFQAVADVVFEDVWGDEQSQTMAVETFAQQLEQLVQFYAEHRDLPRVDLVSRPLLDLFGGWQRQRNYCGAGKHLICLTSAGEQYPCARFSSVTTSQPLKGLEESPDAENSHCAQCLFERLCPTCEGHNFTANGSCWNRTTFHCRFFQVSLLASARLMLVDEPELLRPSTEEKDEGQNLARLRKLVAISAVNDSCNLKGYPLPHSYTPFVSH